MLTQTLALATLLRSRVRAQELGQDVMEWNPWEVNRFTPIDIESGSINFSLNQNLEAKVTDKELGEY